MDFFLLSFLPEIRNLGALSVAANARAAGHGGGMLFLTNPRSKDATGLAFAYNVAETDEEVAEIARFLADRGPQAVGMSLMTAHFERAKRLTHRIREALPGVPILWGGIHPTLAPEECLPEADVVCVGEGEDATIEFLEARTRGDPTTQIGSLWFRTEGGAARNEVRRLREDLSGLAHYRYEFEDDWVLHDGKVRRLDDDLYRTYMHWRGELYNVAITRGCPYHCTYCCNSSFLDLYRGKGKIVRRRGTDDVLSELARARSRFPFLHGVNIQDDSFLMADDAWLAEFCGRYKREVALPFYARTIPTYVTEERIRMLKEAGLDHIQMGLEGSERVNREVFHRAVTNEKFVRAAHVFHRFNVTKHYDIILDNPYASEADLVDIVNTLLATPKPYFISCLSLTFFPFTPLWERARDDGILGKVKQGYGDGITSLSPTYLNHLILVTPLSPRRLVEFFRDGRDRAWVRALFQLYLKGFVSPYYRLLGRLRASPLFLSAIKPAYFRLQALKRGLARRGGR